MEELALHEYLVAPADVLVTVPLDSSYATVSLSREVNPGLGGLRVCQVDSKSPDKDAVATLEGGASISFSTPLDGLYLVELLGSEKQLLEHFYVPIIGRLLSCRCEKLSKALPCGCCPKELDKSLRTLDVLLRAIYASANVGDHVTARALIGLATSLCDTCGCCDE